MQSVAAVLIAFNLNGIFRVVLEAVVQRVAVHCGVGAHHGHVAAVVLMLVALHNLQIGLQGGPVQGGGELADAAGGGVDILAADVGSRLLVAARHGVGAGQGVVGELLAGQQNGAVDPAGRQINVVPAGGGPGAGGGGGAQHVGKELFTQLLGGEIGLGKGQGDSALLPLGGLLQSGAGGVYVEADAGDRGDNLLGFRVQVSVCRLHIELVIDGLEVGLGGRRVGDLGLHRGGGCLAGEQLGGLLLQCGLEGGGIQAAAGTALVEDESGLRLFPGGLSLRVAAVCRRLIYRVGSLGKHHGGVGVQATQKGGEVLAAPDQEGAALGVCRRLDSGGGVHRKAAARHGIALPAAGKLNAQLGQTGVQLLGDGLDSLLLGHAAHADAQHPGVGQQLSAAGHGAQGQVARCQGGNNYNNDDQGNSRPPALCIGQDPLSLLIFHIFNTPMR